VSRQAHAALARGSRSFALAARLLPASCRDDVAVLYAYCRRADDAVDESVPDERPRRVAALFRELDSLYAGEAQAEPLLAAFQAVAARRGIPEAYPRALLEGMRSDIGGVRVQTVSDLSLYAYRVAGVVGLMMCHVLTLSDARALRNAAHLGMAMQLTNICRDVAEDWRLDRLYLPADLLAECGAPELVLDSCAPIDEQQAQPLAFACGKLLALAERYYASGDAGLCALPVRGALAVRSARLIYSEIGRRLLRRGCDVRRGRVVVPKWLKLVLVVRAIGQELAQRARHWIANLPVPQRAYAVRLDAALIPGSDDHALFLSLDA
jgi:phytoene synthase